KQNYPNPFNPITNIEFSIAKTNDVSLIIYNSIGQQVATLVNQQLSPGTYKYDFNASGLPSGSYYYRLTAGDDYVKTNKMILVK
ncbi:MAG: peptidase S8/S53 subtilisin kexin sedolisin, partial [Chlorobi bacterium OLB5]